MIDLTDEINNPTQRTFEVGEAWEEILLPKWPEWRVEVAVEGSGDLWLGLPFVGEGAPEDGAAVGAHARPVAAGGTYQFAFPAGPAGRGLSSLTLGRRLFLAAQGGVVTVYLHLEGQ